MARFRPEREQYCYDPSTYDTYLEQLGIAYPTIREKPEEAGRSQE